MKRTVFVLLLCAFCVAADNPFDDAVVKIALKVYDDCAKAESFSICLRKKAITFMDRLGRTEHFSVGEGVTVKRAADAPAEGPIVSEQELEETLPRSEDAKENALDNIIMDKVTNFVGSRTIEISLPRLLPDDLGVETGNHLNNCSNNR